MVSHFSVSYNSCVCQWVFCSWSNSLSRKKSVLIFSQNQLPYDHSGALSYGIFCFKLQQCGISLSCLSLPFLQPKNLRGALSSTNNIRFLS